jgi:hypothetical protein
LDEVEEEEEEDEEEAETEDAKGDDTVRVIERSSECYWRFVEGWWKERAAACPDRGERRGTPWIQVSSSGL